MGGVTERVVIYCRISEDPRQRELGVKRQRKDCEALAAGRGWTVVGVFTDNDVAVLTAGADRPQYRAMMDLVRTGQADRIVAYGLSRLWRNRRERADAIELLKSRRVSVTLVRGSDLDMTSAMGRMVAGMIGEADTAESELKAERVAAAALQRAEMGKAAGHVAYGWRRVRVRNSEGDVVDWHDEIDPEQAAVVRRIVAWLLEDKPVRWVAARLNEECVPPPRAALRLATGRAPTGHRVATQWNAETVRKIAVRPANAGRIVRTEIVSGEPVRNEDFGPAEAPKIIEPETHARVKALLTDPGRNRRPILDGDDGPPRRRRPGARKHLLTFGVGYCGACGAELRMAVRYRQRGKQDPYPTYQCNGPRSCVTRAMLPVDDLVERVVVLRLQQPDALALLTRDDAAATAARREVGEIEARLDQAQDDYDAGITDRRRYERSMTRWRVKLADAQRQAARVVRGVSPELVAGMAGPEAQSRWDVLDVAQRRALLEAMSLRVTVMPARGGAGFKPESVRIEFDAADVAVPVAEEAPQ